MGPVKRKLDDDEKDVPKRQNSQYEVERITVGGDRLFDTQNQVNFLKWLGDTDNSLIVRLNNLSRKVVQLDKANKIWYNPANHVAMIGKVHLVVKAARSFEEISIDTSKYKRVERITVDGSYMTYIKFSNPLPNSLIELDLQIAALDNSVPIVLPAATKHLTYSLFPWWSRDIDNVSKIKRPAHTLETLHLIDFMFYQDTRMQSRIDRSIRTKPGRNKAELSQRIYRNNLKLRNLDFNLPSTRVLHTRFPIINDKFTYDEERLETLIIHTKTQVPRFYGNEVVFPSSLHIEFFPNTIKELILSAILNEGIMDFSGFTRLESLSFCADEHCEVIYPDSLVNLYADFQLDFTRYDTPPIFPASLRKVYYGLRGKADLDLSDSVENLTVENVRSISGGSKLKYLKIKGLDYPNPIPDLPNLEVLYIHSDSLERDFLRLQSPNLRVLHVEAQLERSCILPNLEYLHCKYHRSNDFKVQFPNLKTLKFTSNHDNVKLGNVLPETLNVLEIAGSVTWENDDDIQLQKFKAYSVGFGGPAYKLNAHRVVVKTIGEHANQLVCTDLKIKTSSRLEEVPCDNLHLIKTSMINNQAMRPLPRNLKTLQVEKFNNCIASAAKTLVWGLQETVIVTVTRECEYLFLSSKRISSSFQLDVKEGREKELKVIVFGNSAFEIMSDNRLGVVYVLGRANPSRLPDINFLVAIEPNPYATLSGSHVYIQRTGDTHWQGYGTQSETLIYDYKVIKQSEEAETKKLLEYAQTIPIWKKPFKSMKQYKFNDDFNQELYRLKRLLTQEKYVEKPLESETDVDYSYSFDNGDEDSDSDNSDDDYHGSDNFEESGDDDDSDSDEESDEDDESEDDSESDEEEVDDESDDAHVPY